MEVPQFITADDLHNLEKCARLVYLDHHGSRAQRAALSDYARWIMEQGAIFEERVVRGYDIYEVTYRPGDPGSAFAMTLELMRQGVPMIYQGVLMHEIWQGRPDILERVDEGRSDLGRYYYRPIDIKSARQASSAHRHQVMFYSFLLEAVQGVAPDGMLLLRVRPEEAQGDELTVAEPVPYLPDVIHSLLAEVEGTIAGEEPPPFISSVCGGCQWVEACLPVAVAAQDVSLLSGIQRRSWRALHERGLGTLRAVAECRREELVQIDGIGAKTAARLHAHAVALVEERPVPLSAPRLPAPVEGEVFFDIEGYSNGDLDCYYLMGLLVRRGGEYVFEYDLAEHPDDEAEMWWQFLERASALDAPVYHYGVYERTAVRRLAEKHGGDERVDRLLDRFVDLHKVVKDCVALPLRGYSLKDVAPWLGYEWSGETQAADESIVEYDRWLKTGDRNHLHHIIVYNEDDVRATVVVRDWLLDLP